MTVVKCKQEVVRGVLVYHCRAVFQHDNCPFAEEEIKLQVMSAVKDPDYVIENMKCVKEGSADGAPDFPDDCIFTFEFDVNLPLLINVSTVIKIKDKHEIGYEFVSNCESMLKNSVLAFESMTHESSVVILLNEFESNTGNPILAICRCNKGLDAHGLVVNEITSVYDKERFLNFLVRTYKADKMFYKNKKTEQYLKPRGLQLPDDLRYALSNEYYKPYFTKSQVENDLKNKRLSTFDPRLVPLDQRIENASVRKRSQNQNRSRRPNRSVR